MLGMDGMNGIQYSLLHYLLPFIKDIDVDLQCL